MTNDISVLFCAFEDGIFSLEKTIAEIKNNVFYFISWQGEENKIKETPSFLKNRSDVTLKRIYGKGLSRNRNNVCSMYLCSEIEGFFLIADDDVVLCENFEQKITSKFESFIDWDIITFKIKTRDSELEYKNYPNRAIRYNLFDLHKVSSIEIAGRKRVLRKVKFDERFGLGAVFPSGEETIFLADVIQKGYRIGFCPEYVVSHPLESSGKKKRFSDGENDIMTIGAKAKRIYGICFTFFFFLFSFSKRVLLYRDLPGSVRYLKLLIRGYRRLDLVDL